MPAKCCDNIPSQKCYMNINRISNHQQLECLFTNVFSLTAKRTSKLCALFCEGNPLATGGSPHKEPAMCKEPPCYDVSMTASQGAYELITKYPTLTHPTHLCMDYWPESQITSKSWHQMDYQSSGITEWSWHSSDYNSILVCPEGKHVSDQTLNASVINPWNAGLVSIHYRFVITVAADDLAP